ncbi:hypothetical protein Goarm_003894 [Gossypium armourianum]|uniref:Uncharacterized protein n=1 Tax=Gossypium armourianum TaxID=34283 RepID=A0A7J9K4P7_9ROSI|nr:hypothetical protein [Gossypium armourianum]
MSKGMACQFGNFIGTFMEHHTALISMETGRFMRIQVKYEKLTLFYFLCGKLCQGEGFCSMQVTFGTQVVEFRWDISLKMGREGVFGGTNLEVSIELASDMEDNHLEVVDGNKKQRTHAGNLNGHINVDEKGSRGGLSLSWNNGCIVHLWSYLISHIDIEIDEGYELDKLRCTRFYGAPDERRRDES